jgi:hypothetical protein
MTLGKAFYCLDFLALLWHSKKLEEPPTPKGSTSQVSQN